jgi:hypothetical protein
METGVIDDNTVHPLVHEAHEVARLRLDAIPASTVGRGRGDSTASTQASPALVSREPKREDKRTRVSSGSQHSPYQNPSPS